MKTSALVQAVNVPVIIKGLGAPVITAGQTLLHGPAGMISQ